MNSHQEKLPNYQGEGYLECAACGYKSTDVDDRLDWKSVYGCRACHKVVNPEVVPFFFRPPFCPDCRGQLAKSDRIFTGQMTGTDFVVCPACNQRRLRYHSHPFDIQWSQRRGPIPAVGLIVHAFWDSRFGDFEVPALSSAITIQTEPRSLAKIADGFHQFEVLESSPKNLVLRHLGPLPDEEGWPDYYGTGGSPRLAYDPSPFDPLLLKELRDMARRGCSGCEILQYAASRLSLNTEVPLIASISRAFHLSIADAKVIGRWSRFQLKEQVPDEEMNRKLGRLLAGSKTEWESLDHQDVEPE